MAAPFWQKPLVMTSLLDVGLRSNYVACHQGADLLIAARVCAAELDKYGNSFGTAETPQFIGRVVLALHGDPDCLEQRSGRVF